MHEYTAEILYHFNCGVCKNWWSYATTPATPNIELGVPKDIEYYCPHCGANELAKIKEGFSYDL